MRIATALAGVMVLDLSVARKSRPGPPLLMDSLPYPWALGDQPGSIPGDGACDGPEYPAAPCGHWVLLGRSADGLSVYGRAA